MDQIKKILLVLHRQHFWLLALLVVLLGAVGWKLASANLRQTFEKNKQKIKGAFDQVRRVQSVSSHPNEKINEGVQATSVVQSLRIHDLWKQIHEQQKAEVLFWPAALGEDFRINIAQLKFGDDIPKELVERYRNYVTKRLEELPKIVNAWYAKNSGTGGSGPFSKKSATFSRPVLGEDGLAKDPDYVVIWEDYGTIEQNLTWEHSPSPKKVWITQEDLWVYETLLEIIRETNQECRGPHDAAVKVIRQLQVGRDAAAGTETSGRIARFGGQSTPSRGMNPFGKRGMMSPFAGMNPFGGGLGGAGQIDPEEEVNLLMTHRYLDNDGQPMEADASTDVIEYKRMPVCMDLQMDQRHLQKLLVHCANAPLPVEVQHVRINPDSSGTGGLGGGPFAMSASTSSSRRKSKRSRTGMSFGGFGGNLDETTAYDPTIIDVIVQGIIYIYNPPDLEALYIESEDLASTKTGGS